MATKESWSKQLAADPPEPARVAFHTRYLRQDLLSRLHVLKSRRNGRREAGAKLVELSAVLNEVLEVGLSVLEQEEGQR